ncbi:MAG: MATE family efflux transporter [Oscillospiraceae bacterium]
MQKENKLAQNFTLASLIKFTLPSTLMMVFMSLYQMVDGVFVSNYVGAEALSALNIVYPIPSILIAVSIMLATGGSAIIARYMGEGKTREAKESFTLICVVAFFFSLLFIILGTVFIEPIIRGLGATDALYAYCYDYLLILILSCPLSIFQMLFQNFLVTAGKPGLGLFCTVLGGMANILLDFVFVGLLSWGVTGAAVATAMGYGIPAVFGLFYFTFKRKGTLYFVRPKWSGYVLLHTCGNGSSEMVTNLANAVTTYLFNVMMLRYVGESGVAAITIVLYAQFLLTSVFMGFSIGAAPIFSYNYGRQNRERIKKLFRLSMIFSAVFSAGAVLISYLFSRQIVGVFARPGTEVFEIAIGGLHIFAVSFAFAGFNIFSSALFTAFSNGGISALISFSRTFIFLIGALLFLPVLLGSAGIFMAVPAAEFLSLFVTVFCLIFYRKKYGY